MRSLKAITLGPAFLAASALAQHDPTVALYNALETAATNLANNATAIAWTVLQSGRAVLSNVNLQHGAGLDNEIVGSIDFASTAVTAWSQIQNEFVDTFGDAVVDDANLANNLPYAYCQSESYHDWASSVEVLHFLSGSKSSGGGGFGWGFQVLCNGQTVFTMGQGGGGGFTGVDWWGGALFPPGAGLGGGGGMQMAGPGGATTDDGPGGALATFGGGGGGTSADLCNTTADPGEHTVKGADSFQQLWTQVLDEAAGWGCPTTLDVIGGGGGGGGFLSNGTYEGVRVVSAVGGGYWFNFTGTATILSSDPTDQAAVDSSTIDAIKDAATASPAAAPASPSTPSASPAPPTPAGNNTGPDYNAIGPAMTKCRLDCLATSNSTVPFVTGTPDAEAAYLRGGLVEDGDDDSSGGSAGGFWVCYCPCQVTTLTNLGMHWAKDIVCSN